MPASLTVDQVAVERARFHARHFVLLTDHLDRVVWSDRRVFDTTDQAPDVVASRRPHGHTDLTERVLKLLGYDTAIYWTPRGKSWAPG